MSPFFYVSLSSWVISLTVSGVSVTNLNEPPRALAAFTIAWVRSVTSPYLKLYYTIPDHTIALAFVKFI